MSLFGFLSGEGAKPNAKDIKADTTNNLAPHPSDKDLQTMANHPDFNTRADAHITGNISPLVNEPGKATYDAYSPENNLNIATQMQTVEAALSPITIQETTKTPIANTQEVAKPLETITKNPNKVGEMRRKLASIGSTSTFAERVNNQSPQNGQQAA